MTNPPCEYQLTNCQKKAIAQHYLPNSNFTQSCWVCANCWEKVIKETETN